eukprot:SAG31_NODE_47120_length_251_cov_1.322368_1_plen_47_part_10
MRIRAAARAEHMMTAVAVRAAVGAMLLLVPPLLLLAAAHSPTLGATS